MFCFPLVHAMGPYAKAVAFVIRLIAFGLIAVSLVSLLSHLFYVIGDKKAPERGVLWFAMQSLPMAGGIVVWIFSSRMARRLTDDLEE